MVVSQPHSYTSLVILEFRLSTPIVVVTKPRIDVVAAMIAPLQDLEQLPTAAADAAVVYTCAAFLVTVLVVVLLIFLPHRTATLFFPHCRAAIVFSPR